MAYGRWIRKVPGPKGALLTRYIYKYPKDLMFDF